MRMSWIVRGGMLMLILGNAMFSMAAEEAATKPADEPDYSYLPTSAEEINKLAGFDFAQAAAKCKIGIAEAMQIAEKSAGGKAIGARMEQDVAGLKISVEVVGDGLRKEVTVSGQTGELIGTRDLPDIYMKGWTVTGEPAKTESGVIYYDIAVGEGQPIPDENARLQVHYTGWLANGQMFSSSRVTMGPAKPASFTLSGLIPGWKDGLRSMRVGGKRKLVVPYQLAYGEPGRPPRIPGKATLIFDVELLDAQPGPKPQSRPAATTTRPAPTTTRPVRPDAANRTQSSATEQPAPKMTPLGASGYPGEAVTGEPVSTPTGLKYFDMAAGEGKSPAGPLSKVKFHYTAYLPDGRRIVSTHDDNQPVTRQLNAVIQGWAEGIASMKAGGKRKLVLPPELAFGDRGSPPSIPPRSAVIYDIELLEVED